MFLGASSVKLFHFTPFDRKRLQTAPEAGGEAQSNEALYLNINLILKTTNIHLLYLLFY